MAKILLAWELGGGYGHLRPHAQTLRRLADEGHEIHVAGRELHRVLPGLRGLPTVCWQAPFCNDRPDPHYRPTRNFAQILHNCGFASTDGVLVRVSAWRNLLAAIDPDVVVADYAPSALLALRGSGIPTILVGTGFVIPVDESPMPRFPVVAPPKDPEELIRCEANVLAAMNAALTRFQAPLLYRVSQLFADADEIVLQTYPELDHYGPRKGIRYGGIGDESGGLAPEWPTGDGPRVFAYLKPFPEIEKLFAVFAASKASVLVAADGIPSDVANRWQSSRLRIVPPKLDLIRAAAECDAAVANAGHSTACRFLLAGKPALHLPLQQEQEITALRIARLGLGLAAHPRKPERFAAAFERLLTDPTHVARAQSFSTKNSRIAASDMVATATLRRLKQRVTTIA